ncbi:MAG: hypothetical protein J0M15_03420 [Deltaproteobacteria bacterium]|nr:hypothetical protein [Deltaproteobacteria bacterium]
MKPTIGRTFSGAPWEKKVGYCRAIRMGNTIAVTGTTSITDDGKVFADHPPATTMVEIKALIDPSMLVEIEADAVVLQP